MQINKFLFLISLTFLLSILLCSSLIDPSETRFMRSDSHTINGLSAYKLSTSQSNSTTELFIDMGTKICIGIRVWIRHVNETETEVLGLSGQASAVVSYSSGTAQTTTLSAGFEVSKNYSLVSTDAILVKVYADTSNPPSSLLASFVTEQLNGQTLNATTWIVYYRLRRTKAASGISSFYFRFGSTNDNSRIENFTYTIPPLPPLQPQVILPFEIKTNFDFNLLFMLLIFICAVAIINKRKVKKWKY